LQYRNGNSFYVWHGVEVCEETILSPQTITRKTIELEPNSERRRIMIERFGLERYVEEGGFKLAHQLPANFPNVGLRTAKLWVQTFPFNETLVYVDLLNSTAEPDGTTKRYMLRVDPLAYSGDAARQVQAAAASTWRDAEGQLIFEDWRDYAPEHES
jgi:hypothetical protein